MRSLAASFKWLVIPGGSTTGRRILIDGANGLIAWYDSAGVRRLTAGGPASSADNFKTWTGDATETDGGSIGSNALTLARLSLQLLSPRRQGQADRARIDISSPVADPGTDRALIQLTSVLAAGVDLILDAATIAVTEGANRTMGLATLAAGTVVVNNSRVTANSRIFLSRQAPGGALGHLYADPAARVAGTSFTITSSSATDTSTVAWLLIEPN